MLICNSYKNILQESTLFAIESKSTYFMPKSMASPPEKIGFMPVDYKTLWGQLDRVGPNFIMTQNLFHPRSSRCRSDIIILMGSLITSITFWKTEYFGFSLYNMNHLPPNLWRTSFFGFSENCHQRQSFWF